MGIVMESGPKIVIRWGTRTRPGREEHRRDKIAPSQSCIWTR